MQYNTIHYHSTPYNTIQYHAVQCKVEVSLPFAERSFFSCFGLFGIIYTISDIGDNMAAALPFASSLILFSNIVTFFYFNEKVQKFD